MKTLAAVLVQQNAPLEFWELDIPPLSAGQVLVEMAYSGLCHTQLNEIRGMKGPDPFLPHTLGHEGSGVVLEVGANVTKIAPGDLVVLTWLKGSGADVPSCKYGKVNSGAISTFLERAVVSENRVVPLPVEMPLREAALLGCALPTGAGAVRHQMKLEKGDSFALFGAGGVGLSALLAATSAGAFPRIAVDIQSEKLALASSCGATHLIDAGSENPTQRILEITENRGVDYAFESAGKRVAMEGAFESLRAPGGLCVVAGNLPKGERISLDPFDLIRGKKIIGSWGGSSSIDEDVQFYAQLFLRGELNLGALITHEVPLLAINRLIDSLAEGRVARGLISFDFERSKK